MKKVTLFVGLNSQHSGRQELSTLDAYKVAQSILADAFGGSTIYEGIGSYRMQASGELIKEASLVCVVFGADDDEKLARAIRALKVALDQESVGVEVTDTDFGYR